MNVYWSSAFGFFLGFAFGVGCALAVMYSIYMGGYRAAVKDSLLAIPPERLLLARARAISRPHPAPPSPGGPPASGIPRAPEKAQPPGPPQTPGTA